MRSFLLRSLLLASLGLLGGGCVSHTHAVGLGPTGAEVKVARQYYLLYGLFEINDVDTARMAGDMTSYSIETKFGFVDLLLSPFLGALLTTSRTVIVRT